MANQFGVGYNFGFTGTDGIVISGTGIGTLTLQNASLSNTADKAEVRDGDGDLANVTFYNLGNKATLEYMPRGTTVALAVAASTIPTQGTIVTITTCASLTDLVASTWYVDGEPQISGSNTDFKRVTLPLSKHAGITAAVAAS